MFSIWPSAPNKKCKQEALWCVEWLRGGLTLYEATLHKPLDHSKSCPVFICWLTTAEGPPGDPVPSISFSSASLRCCLASNIFDPPGKTGCSEPVRRNGVGKLRGVSASQVVTESTWRIAVLEGCDTIFTLDHTVWFL